MIIPASIALLLNVNGGTDTERERRLDIAQFSFETGCLIGAQESCSGSDAVECRERALKSCPESAKKYRNWLENGK